MLAASSIALVDRREELRLDAALARAASGDPTVVVLAGDAGVGKSCLLRSFAERADAAVLFGTCSAAGDVPDPLTPFVDAFRFSPGIETIAELVEPVLDLVLTGRSVSHPGSLTCQTEVFETVLDLVEQLAERRSTLLVLEDLHVADSTSLDLLTFIVANLRRQRLAVLVSYRTEDLVAAHPWRPMLTELVRHPRVDHIDVAPFDRGQVIEQLRHLTGRCPDEATVDEMLGRTLGNPYFVEELTDHEHRGVRAVSSSLRELLLVKVEALSATTGRLLRIMALGRPDVADSLLAEVAGTDVDSVRTAQREALDQRVLSIGPAGLRFRHALVREALEQDLLTGERRDIHAAFARALSARTVTYGNDRAGHLATLAHHWFGAGDESAGARTSVEAAGGAERIFAWAEAHDLLERVLQHWDRLDEPELVTGSSRIDILRRAAESAFLAGRAERACELARDALGLIDEVSAPHAAGMLYERLARYSNDTSQHARGLEYCSRAVALVAPSPATVERARVLAGWAGQLMIIGRLEESRAAGAEALDMARATGAIDAEIDALNTLGVITGSLDDDQHGLAMIRSALHMAREHFNAHQQIRARVNLFASTFDTARWEEALERFHEARAAMPRLGANHEVPELIRCAVDILVRLGRWDEADRLVDEGLADFPGRRDQLVPIELPIGRGQFDKARELVAARATRDVFIDEESRSWPLVNLADIEAWSGRTEPAREAIDDALSADVDCSFPLLISYAVAIGIRVEADAADAARRNAAVGEERLAVERAEALIGRIRALFERPGPAGGWRRECGALALAAEAEYSRAMGAPDPDAWAAAVSAWLALGMTFEAARCRYGQAAALLAAGSDRVRASALLVEARAVATSIGAEPLREQIDVLARRARIDVGDIDPDVNDSGPATYGLTQREHEVLALLASGATNRGIAEDLFISVKTAGVHVSNILRKLGVANRSEATSVAFRDGLVS